MLLFFLASKELTEMDDTDVEKLPLNDKSNLQDTTSSSERRLIISEDGDPSLIHSTVETHTVLSAIVKSTDGKFHRLNFDSTEKKLEFVLLK